MWIFSCQQPRRTPSRRVVKSRGASRRLAADGGTRSCGKVPTLYPDLLRVFKHEMNALPHSRWNQAALFICATLFVSFAAHLSSQSPKPEEEKLIDALASVDFGLVYAEDGAADGSITDKRTVLVNQGPKAFQPVQAILDLKERSIPLLIEHLDDSRPTLTRFAGKPVPVGYLGLDILMNVIGSNHKVFFTDCRDDGLGACVEPKYYFRPNASSDELRRVKANWQKLYRARRLKYREPSS